MKLNKVVPWGRTLDEYKQMFNLSATDLSARILGCGDGPASFNAEMTALGRSVVSVDPIYRFSAEQIRQQVRATYALVIARVKQHSESYVWTHFRNADELGRARLAAMEKFLLDYETDLARERYLAQSLPGLDLSEHQFDLCVCSHLLFLYSEQLSLDFHLVSIHKLLRLSSEIRIFPLVQLDGKPSPHLDRVIQEFSSKGVDVQVQPVAYEFQKGGNQMLKFSQ